jgi:hypothetical protein
MDGLFYAVSGHVASSGEWWIARKKKGKKRGQNAAKYL